MTKPFCKPTDRTKVPFAFASNTEEWFCTSSSSLDANWHMGFTEELSKLPFSNIQDKNPFKSPVPLGPIGKLSKARVRSNSPAHGKLSIVCNSFEYSSNKPVSPRRQDLFIVYAGEESDEDLELLKEAFCTEVQIPYQAQPDEESLELSFSELLSIPCLR